MNRAINLRLIALGLAVAVVGALIVLVTLNSERQARNTSARLGDVDTESFQIADRFRDKFRYAHDKLRSYASAREPIMWEEFLTAGEDVGRWIKSEQLLLKADQEKAVLKQMEAGFTAYLEAARNLHGRMEATGESGASLAEYRNVQMQARHLTDLGQDLSRVHYHLSRLVLDDASEALTQLHMSVLGLVGLLFIFGVGLAAGVYRDLIAPLRVKLVESQAVAERHEKLASLGLLAAGVAHEIRNPLTAIKAAVFLQQKKFRPGSPERGDLELVEREISRLEHIVSDFLEFARPTPPKLSAIPAEQPLQEIQALFEDQFSAAGIQLRWEAPPGMRIQVDAEQIKQVLINLVKNAAESLNGGGAITLRARQDRRQLTNGNTDVVVLEVSDTGRGIPAEVEKRLFDPFFTTKAGGTGLGLSIAARIVERHGGALQYQTLPNRGTTFGIVLPKAE